MSSGKKLFETFFVGNNGTQYYIKPITFSDEENDKLKFDMTFRYKNVIKDSATLNMSFIDSEIIKSIDSLKISNDSISLLFTKVNLMFVERHKKVFNSRFSTRSHLAPIKWLFKNKNWSIYLYRNNIVDKYMATKSTKRKITKLKFEIFELF